MKIFGIGLHKTGTSSLHLAFLLLGLRSRHYFPDEVPLDKLDCFSDMPIPLIYPQLDRRCPGSKFILTTRRRDAWLDSCRRWFAPTALPDAPHVEQRVLECYGTTTFDEAVFGAVYDRHHDEVRRYFAKRPDDLLEWNLIDEPRWEPLCQFLGLPIPPQPFPHANEYRTVSRERAEFIHRIESAFNLPYWQLKHTHLAEQAIQARLQGLNDPQLEKFMPQLRLIRPEANTPPRH